MPTDDLRELAEAATPGEWTGVTWLRTIYAESDDEGLVGRTRDAVLARVGYARDAEYILAAQPKRIRELLDERDRLRQELQDATDFLADAVDLIEADRGRPEPDDPFVAALTRARAALAEE